jgi:hypothetical protein
MTRNQRMKGKVKMWTKVPRGVMVVWRLCKHLQVQSRQAGPPRNAGLVESAKRAHQEVQRLEDRLSLLLQLSI